MLYFDYTFDLDPNYIVLDEEINIDRLGWRAGDYFQVKNENGKVMLVKVDPLVAFVQGVGNGHSRIN